MKRKTIIVAALTFVTLLVPLSLYSQSKDFQMNGTMLVKYNGNAANVTIPEGVTVIGPEAFMNNRSLTNITIPSSVTTIGISAFWECTGLTSVTIPSSVTSIGDKAFQYCNKLANVVVSRKTTIGKDAFPDTTRITYSD